MSMSIDMRAKLIRDAGAGRFFGPARFDAIEQMAKHQIREAVDSALHKHGIEPRNASFYEQPDTAAA